MYSPVMRENVLQTLCWTTRSTGSGVHGVVGAAVHKPVVMVVCGYAHVSAIPLSKSWVMTELRRKGRKGGRKRGREEEGQGCCTWPNGAIPGIRYSYLNWGTVSHWLL